MGEVEFVSDSRLASAIGKDRLTEARTRANGIAPRPRSALLPCGDQRASRLAQSTGTETRGSSSHPHHRTRRRHPRSSPPRVPLLCVYPSPNYLGYHVQEAWRSSGASYFCVRVCKDEFDRGTGCETPCPLPFENLKLQAATRGPRGPLRRTSPPQTVEGPIV